MIKKEKLIFVSPYAVYKDVDHAGGRMMYYMIECLAQKYELRLLCLTRNAHERDLVRNNYNGRIAYETFDDIGPIRNILSNPFKLFKYPPDVLKHYNKSLYQRIEALAKSGEYRFIQFEYTGASIYSDAARNIPLKIIDHHDIGNVPLYRWARFAHNPFVRLIYLIRAVWLYAYEKKLWKRVNGVIVRSEADRERVLKTEAKLKIGICRHPVQVANPDVCVRQKKYALAYLGSMRRKENIDAVEYFTENIFPLIKRSLPQASLVVIGSSPPDKMLGYSGKNGILITGWVDNISGYILDAQVFIAPIRIGGGVLVKVLEAMALGIPVVATSIANEGIAAKEGESILIADDPLLFAEKVLKLLNDPELASRIGRAGREFININHSQERSESDLLEYYNELVKG